VIDAALDAARPVAEAKRVTLIKSGQARDVLMGDATRLQQVMINLLTNAVKFTPDGGRVSVRLESDERAASVIVEDSGQGISADFLPYVFERFWQADSSYTRKHSGLGLGLAIVRHLVELHGGTVSAASEGIGRGSTFTVTLPLTLAQKTFDSAATSDVSESSLHGSALSLPLKGVKVLVVDDDRDTREMLTALLALYGAETLTAANAVEAFHRLREWRPDLLLSDLGMPDEDGYTLIGKVRSLPLEAGGDTPAVALTGYASEEERDRVHAAGFQAHEAKPVEASKLVETIARLVEVGGKRGGA
jgi:CheY-like chemotaxis protein/anti-sigma regulatory factor (Ser/Thr protein kinase)